MMSDIEFYLYYIKKFTHSYMISKYYNYIIHVIFLIMMNLTYLFKIWLLINSTRNKFLLLFIG